MTTENRECNISFMLEDDSNNENIDVSMFEDLEQNCELLDLDTNIFSFYEKLTCKDLLLICEYYGMAKEIKTNKYKKEQIIFLIASFESNPNNLNIVFQRKNIWFYMNEIKNDKIMKKYLLC